MAFAFISFTLATPADVETFRRGTRAEFVASLLENGVDAEALGPERAARMQLLLAAFDKNHNGKIDPDERPALVEFLIRREEMQSKK